MRSARSLVLSLIVVASLLGGSAASPAAPRDIVEPGLLDHAGPVDVIARFERDVPSVLAGDGFAGATVRYRFASVPAVFLHAEGAAAVRALAELPGLAYLEADKSIAYELDTATVATRARDVWAPTAGEPIRDADGAVVDGSGVGVAIVDTGLDGFHPDYQAPGKVGGNYQVTPAGLISGTYTSNPNSAHGTHVAGIAVGNGDRSGGVYRGVAPGATLYSFNMFAGVDGTVILPAIAFDWILQHGDEQDPPIRVVNNSWRCLPRVCRNAFNPDQLHTRLASMLAESGVVVTWSAGNEGGDGSVAMTNADARNQTPGIISVANYKDERSTFETGVRDHRLSGTSSRGDSRDPTTWPDVSAPGSDVYSTWAAVAQVESTRFVGRNPLTGDNPYYILSGTSMAAPHVAGIVALMLQANPGLTPAEVEYIVKATADELPGATGYLRADPSHPYDGANYAAGHGLVDALAAVQAAGSFTNIPTPPEPEAIPESFLVSRAGVDVQQTLYLTGDGGLVPDAPEGPGTATHQDIHQYLSYQSAPLTDAVTLDAVSADLFIGSMHEYVITTHASLRFRIVVERVDGTGARTALGEGTEYTWYALTAAPFHRRFHVFFDEVATIAPGERVSLKVILEKRPGSDPATVSDLTLITGGIVVYTGRPTASRIGLGTRVEHPEPGSDVACHVRQDCAALGGVAEASSLTCGSEPTRLRWHGPAASGLLFECDGNTHTCLVPGLPGDPEGDCETVVEPVTRTAAVRDGQCWYVTPDGRRAGNGRCEVLTFLEGRN